MRKNRTFRISDALDEQLQTSAAKSERSVSEEIEYRLSRSYYDDLLTAGFLGSDTSGEAIRIIRLAMAIQTLAAGKPWNEDAQSTLNVREAANTIISTLGDLPPEERLGKAAASWSSLLTSFLLLTKTPGVWQLTLPPELKSFAEHAERMLMKIDFNRRSLSRPTGSSSK
jgi:hypothetical protein